MHLAYCDQVRIVCVDDLRVDGDDPLDLFLELGIITITPASIVAIRRPDKLTPKKVPLCQVRRVAFCIVP